MPYTAKMYTLWHFQATKTFTKYLRKKRRTGNFLNNTLPFLQSNCLCCVYWLTGWHWPDFQVMIQLYIFYYGMEWYWICCFDNDSGPHGLNMVFKIWNINCKTRRIILKHWNSVLRLHRRQVWRIQMNLIFILVSILFGYKIISDLYLGKISQTKLCYI